MDESFQKAADAARASIEMLGSPARAVDELRRAAADCGPNARANQSVTLILPTAIADFP